MRFSMRTPIGKPRRKVLRMQPRCQTKARSLMMLSAHVVSCGFAICPTMPSTASVGMKQPFGAKLDRFCLRSTIWIAASHRRECGVSVLAGNKHSQASGATSVEGGTASGPSLQRSKDHCTRRDAGVWSVWIGSGALLLYETRLPVACSMRPATDLRLFKRHSIRADERPLLGVNRTSRKPKTWRRSATRK